MRVTVEYAAQLKRAAGVGSEEFQLDERGSLHNLVSQMAQRHGEPLRRLLIDAKGRLQTAILVFLNDEQVRGDDVPLQDGSVVTFLSPISGG